MLHGKNNENILYRKEIFFPEEKESIVPATQHGCLYCLQRQSQRFALLSVLGNKRKFWLICSTSDPMAMACTPAYWANKKCRPVIHAGGFSVVSFLGSSRLWCFLGGLKLHKNCHATQANMQARHECSTNMLSKQAFQGTYAPSRRIRILFNPKLFLSWYGFRPHGY